MGISGIILSGGKSTRMGAEKGLCLLNGKPLIEYAVDVLQKTCHTILISANDHSYDYLGFPVIPDEFEDKGPAGGIYSCLRKSETRNNIILSCDLPLITEEFIRYIISCNENYDAVISLNADQLEPLCGLYSVNCIPALKQGIIAGNLKIRKILSDLNCRYVKIEPGMSNKLFTNVNTPEDLMKLEILMKDSF